VKLVGHAESVPDEQTPDGPTKAIGDHRACLRQIHRLILSVRSPPVVGFFEPPLAATIPVGVAAELRKAFAALRELPFQSHEVSDRRRWYSMEEVLDPERSSVDRDRAQRRAALCDPALEVGA
jgi:hypothetical protein